MSFVAQVSGFGPDNIIRHIAMPAMAMERARTVASTKEIVKAVSAVYKEMQMSGTLSRKAAEFSNEVKPESIPAKLFAPIFKAAAALSKDTEATLGRKLLPGESVDLYRKVAGEVLNILV